MHFVYTQLHTYSKHELLMNEEAQATTVVLLGSFKPRASVACSFCFLQLREGNSGNNEKCKKQQAHFSQTVVATHTVHENTENKWANEQDKKQITTTTNINDDYDDDGCVKRFQNRCMLRRNIFQAD